MAELGQGYISIIPEVSKISPGVSKALNGLDPVAEKSGKSMGGRISSGLGTALKASVAGVGLATGGVIAGAISKGMGRLTGIENAQASLRGLGHDAQTVESIMDNALASVSGTAFGLEAAAGVAASAVAAGIEPGADLERTLKMVGDAATIAGVEMSDMGSIVNKVATADMAQMDVMNQLMDAGIPILQMVADEMGVTAEQARKMASEGKVSFETFQTALENGVGGAALEAGNTFQGAMANMGAALGRVGATAMTPFFDLAKQGFGETTAVLDGVNAALKPLVADFGVWLQGTAVPALGEFKTSMIETWNAARGSSEVQSLLARTGTVIGDLVATGRELGPVFVQAGSALAQASAALGVGTWQLALVGMEGFAAAAKLVTPPLEMITSLMQDHPKVVAAAMAAWGATRTLPGIVTKLGGSVSGVTSALGPAVTNTRHFGAALGEAYGYARQANPEMGRIGAAMSVLGGQGGVAAAGFDKLKGAASGVMGLFGGPWGVALMAAGAVIGGVVQANQRAETAQREMADAARDSADAQNALQVALAGTRGALDDQGLAAAARVAKNELTEFVEVGDSLQGVFFKIPTTAARGTEAWQKQMDAGYLLRDSYRELESAADDLGIPMESLHDVVASGDDEFYALVDSLRASGEAGNHAADQLEATRGKLDLMIGDAKRLDPAVAQAATAIEGLADSASTADEKLGHLRSMLQAMGLAPKDAELAMRDAAEAVDEIVEAATSSEVPLANMGQGLVDAARAGDWTHEGWRDLSRTLEGLGADLENVAVNGGDVTEAYEGQQAALDALAKQYGISRSELDELGRSMGLVPEEIKTSMALDGADEVAKSLFEVWAALQGAEEGATVTVNALTEDAEHALTRIGFKVEEIPDSDLVRIHADTDTAQTKLDGVFRQMGELGGLEISPTVLLNTMPLVGSAAHAEDILAALDIQEPTPEANLIIEKLQSGVTISQGELDFLASQTPTPIADLNKQLLESGVGVSTEMLDALHVKHTQPTVGANADPLRGEVDSANAKLNSLPSERIIKIRTQHWTEYYSTGRAVSTGGTAVGQHYGATGGRFDPMSGFAQLPAHAAGARHPGYRIPKTGPGTNVVDGFLALTDDGVPTARLNRGEWVINGPMSDRYDRELAMMNAGVFPKLPGFESGGKLQEAFFAAVRDYGASQATGLLDMFGLGPLVGMGVSLWDRHGRSPSETPSSGGRAGAAAEQVVSRPSPIVIELKGVSEDDLVRVGDLKEQIDRIDDLELKVTERKRPAAAAVTRGGAM